MSAEGQTIPDDVREAAILAVDAAREGFLLAKVSDSQANLRKVAIGCVEQAILTERTRCARIAEGSAKTFDFQRALADSDDVSYGRNGARIDIARAIRGEA